jgi:hypothetical protein
MPTVTRNVAKGIPPQQRSSAGAAKRKAKKPVPKAHKRKATESDANNSDSGHGSEAEPRAKKRRKRRQEPSSKQELEVVDSASEAAIEEIEDDENTGDSTSNDSQVNTTLFLKQKTLTLSIGARRWSE